jgi:hypothetical protein
MLQFEIIDEFGRPHCIRGKRVLVRQVETTTPVMVAAETGPGMLEVASAKDNDFNQALRMLGILETVLVTTLDKSALPPITL